MLAMQLQKRPMKPLVTRSRPSFTERCTMLALLCLVLLACLGSVLRFAVRSALRRGAILVPRCRRAGLKDSRRRHAIVAVRTIFTVFLGIQMRLAEKLVSTSSRRPCFFGRLLGFRLLFPHVEISPMLGEQLLVSPSLADLTLVHNYDLIRMSDGGQTVAAANISRACIARDDQQYYLRNDEHGPW